MPTPADIAQALREKNPKFKDLSDLEIETIVGSADARYRDLFDRAHGTLPSLGPEKPPDPKQYEAPSSDRQRALEQMQRDFQPTPLTMDSAVHAIPAAAGMAGGAAGFAVGGPFGAIGGATAAGSAGEGLRQWIQSKRGKEGPRPMSERAADVVTEGGIQGLNEVFGQGVAGLQRAVAPALYKYALKPSPRAQREFPTMAEDALAARVPISKLGQARAAETAAARGTEANAMIQAAEDAGARLIDPMTDVWDPMIKEVGPMAENQAKGGLPGGRETLAKRRQDFEHEFRNPPPRTPSPPVEPRPLTPGNVALAEQQAQLGPAQSRLVPASIFGPTSHEVRTGLELGPQASLVPQRMISGPEPVAPVVEAAAPELFRKAGLMEGQGIKREMQSLSDKLFRSQEAGNEIDSVGAEATKSLGHQWKVALEDRVGGLKEKNAEAQRAMGVEQGIASARERSGGLRGALITGGVAAGPALALATGNPMTALALAGTGALVKGATSPYALSHGAITLDRLGKHPVAQANVYRAMVEALRQSLAEDQSQQDGQP